MWSLPASRSRYYGRVIPSSQAMWPLAQSQPFAVSGWVLDEDGEHG